MIFGGGTEVFQADGAGSTPAARSMLPCRSGRLSRVQPLRQQAGGVDAVSRGRRDAVAFEQAVERAVLIGVEGRGAAADMLAADEDLRDGGLAGVAVERGAQVAAEIAALRARDGQPYRLFPLPWAKPVIDEGRRLAASYANFLIINGAVLIPAYGDEADAMAAAVLAAAYPGRDIVPVPCRSLIWQNGSLHCVTMQLPRGLVASG